MNRICKYCLIVIMLPLSSYSQSKKINAYDEQAVKYNNLAVDLYLRYYYDSDSVEKVLQFYDDAIKIDSTYVYAYYNKSKVFLRQQKLDQALLTLNKALEYTEKNVLGIKFLKANILYRLYQRKEADSIYNELRSEYRLLSHQYPDSPNLFLNIAMLDLLIYGEEKGEKEYRRLLKKFPHDYEVQTAEYFFYDRTKLDIVLELTDGS